MPNYSPPLEHCGAVQCVLLPLQGCELVMPQRSPDIARFRAGTGNPREKDGGRKGKETEREGERQQGKEWDREKRKKKGQEICFWA